jgi:secondary thiamine-phosphate synthase enzyme
LLQQAQHRILVSTRGPGFTDLTAQVADWLGQIGANAGLLTVFVRHTSASLTIQENADPDVQRDLLNWLEGAAPRGARYLHSSEGADDMPAHIRSMLTATNLSIPVAAAKTALGTWQAIYLIEHRDGRHDREVALQFIGTLAA